MSLRQPGDDRLQSLLEAGRRLFERITREGVVRKSRWPWLLLLLVVVLLVQRLWAGLASGILCLLLLVALLGVPAAVHHLRARRR